MEGEAILFDFIDFNGSEQMQCLVERCAENMNTVKTTSACVEKRGVRKAHECEENPEGEKECIGNINLIHTI